MICFLEIVAVLSGIIGLLGCILPVLPGPPLSYAGLAIMYFWANPLLADGSFEITGRFMLTWFLITVVVTLLDYIVPVFFTKITGGSKEAVRCSIAGTIVGLVFFPPFGIIAGAFLGAFFGEMIFHSKGLGASLLSGLGSFLGFMFGTGLKVAASGMMMYYILKFI